MQDHKDLSDEKQMELFLADQKAELFTPIYKRYFPLLTKYVTWLTQDQVTAKEIAQIVLIKVYEKPELFDPSRNFKVWLFTIARNQLRNNRRNALNRFKHQIQFSRFESSLPGTDPREHEQATLELTYHAVNRLSDHHKEVILLKYSSNFTIEEISQILSCKEGTIKSRLFYAIQSLRKIILVES